jgi:basic amino acid/polyamine antiporter, APA family
VIPGKAEFLGNIYAFGAMLSFTIAHLAIIRLRLNKPDARRPWRGPGNIELSGGRSIPVFAVAGGIGTALAFAVVTALHVDVALAGIGWLALGCSIYPIYRRRQGLDLTTTTKVAIQRPVLEHEAEYESVLVALDSTQSYPRGAIAAAAKLAARRRRGIHVLVWISVPQSAPIDAAMPEAEQAAESLIEQARIQGGRRVTGHWEKVRPGQAGRMIVEEARELHAQAVVMPLPPRTGGTLFGKTVETVLAERPCRVIIQSDPADLPAARGAPVPA